MLPKPNATIKDFGIAVRNFIIVFSFFSPARDLASPINRNGKSGK